MMEQASTYVCDVHGSMKSLTEHQGWLTSHSQPDLYSVDHFLAKFALNYY